MVMTDLFATCRSARKDEKQRDEQRKLLGLPEHVKLLQESAADGEAAAMVHFGNGSGFANSRCSFLSLDQICTCRAYSLAAHRRSPQHACLMYTDVQQEAQEGDHTVRVHFLPRGNCGSCEAAGTDRDRWQP